MSALLMMTVGLHLMPTCLMFSPLALWPKGQEHPACKGENVSIVDDQRRLDTAGGGDLCDSDRQGWHRFQINGVDVNVSTSCVQRNHCGTTTGIWLVDTESPIPPPGEVGFGKSCRIFDAPGRNIPDRSYIFCCKDLFYVYLLNCGNHILYGWYNFRDKHCNAAFCVTAPGPEATESNRPTNNDSVGTSVNSDTVGTSVNSDTVGTSGNSDTVDTSVNSDTVGTSVNSDTVGTSVNSGTVGTSVNSGTVGTSVNSDTVGTSVNSDTVGTSGKNVLAMTTDVDTIGSTSSSGNNTVSESSRTNGSQRVCGKVWHAAMVGMLQVVLLPFLSQH